MVPLENFKILGITSILIILVGCVFLVYKWPGKLSMSLSEHAAQTKAASIYYAVFLIPSITLFYLFAAKWFIPAFQLNHWATYVLAIGVLGQYVACFVPDTTGLASRVHQLGAYTMSVTLGIMLVYTILAPDVSDLARWIDIVILLTMLYLYGLFLFVPKARQKFLLYQSSYIALFFTSILVTTYIR